MNWHCPYCTLQNSRLKRKCEACGSARPSDDDRHARTLNSSAALPAGRQTTTSSHFWGGSNASLNNANAPPARKKQRSRSTSSGSVSEWLRKKKEKKLSADCDASSQSQPNPTAVDAPEPESGRTVIKVWHCSTCGLYTLAKECGKCGAARPSTSNHQHTSGGHKGKDKKRTTESDPSGGGNKKKNSKTKTSISSQGGAGRGEAGAGDEVDIVSAQIASVTRHAIEDLRLCGDDLIHFVVGAVGQEHPLITRDHIVVGVRAYHETKAAALATATANLNSSAQKLLSKRKRSAWEESSLLASSSSSSSQQQQSVGTSRPPALPVIDITNVQGIPRVDGNDRMMIAVSDNNTNAAVPPVPAALETNPTAVRRYDGKQYQPRRYAYRQHHQSDQNLAAPDPDQGAEGTRN